MKTFEQLGISGLILPSLQKMNFLKPTDIQRETIPFTIDGKDILASAQTGTGKTGAFAIPLVSFIIDSQRSGLILTPTRELAAQVMSIIKDLIGENLKIKTALLIGGEPMNRQLKQLQNNPRIVVGTPGRINDHLKRGTLNISKTDFLVIDETDRMLDMGFSVQIDEIIKHMPKQKQTLMFSATIDKTIVNLSKKYLNNPERVCIDSNVTTNPNIDQKILKVSEDDKYGELKKQIDNTNGSVIVFVNTKYGADKLAKRITADGYPAKAMHSGLRQDKRNILIKNFREKKHKIMIATDVASRGIDIPHIEHVVIYDLPQCLDDYTHRVGRTGRAGSKGTSVCFITPKEHKKSYPIRKIIDPSISSTSEQPSNKPINKPFTKKRTDTAKVKFSRPKSKESGAGDKSSSAPYAKRFATKESTTGDKSRSAPYAKKFATKESTTGDKSRSAPYAKKFATKESTSGDKSRSAPYAKKFATKESTTGDKSRSAPYAAKKFATKKPAKIEGWKKQDRAH